MNADDTMPPVEPDVPMPPPPSEVEQAVQPAKKRTFEEWSDCFQRFTRKTSLYSILAILAAAVICGIIYGIAAWQIAQQ